MVFNATRKTELPFIISMGETKITFENVIPNSGDARNPENGTFVAPQSGLYLFTFRGNVTFPNESLDDITDDFHIVFILNLRTRIVPQGLGRMGKVIGDYTVTRRPRTKKFAYVEFDKMFKVKQGDKVQVDARSGMEFNATFSSSTSFSVYLLNE